jgi:lipopolysaccharide transport system ATP-binding protein
MEKVTHEGRTILFVSHNLAAVRSLCPTSIFLEHGKLQFVGDTETAMHMYLEDNQTRNDEDAVIQTSMRAQILNIAACDPKGEGLQIFPHDKPVHVRIKTHFRSTTFKMHLTLSVYNSSLDTILVTHDFGSEENSLIPTISGVYEFHIQIPGNFLTPGKYYLGAQISRQSRNGSFRPIHKLEHKAEFEVFDNGSFLSRINIPWQGYVHNPKIQWTRLDP